MRKTLLILSLVSLAVLAHAGDALSQGRGGGRGYGGGGRGYGGGGRGYGGGWGYSPGLSINVGRGGYYSPYGYYGGLGYQSYYQDYDNSYPFAPSYYGPPTVLVPSTQARPSFYPTLPTAEQPANVTVFVPATAQIWFDNSATTQKGTERLFHSPPLEPNHTFSYTIKVRWMENGQAVNRERQVNVQAGQDVTVDFRESPRENVAPPLPRRLPDGKPRE